MQTMTARALICSLLFAAGSAEQVRNNPLGAATSLIDDLIAKITKDGEAEAKAYQEYVEWCDDTAKNTGFAIETSQTLKAQLTAKLGQISSGISVAGAKIDDLAAAIASGEADLKDAVAIRKKEAADFAASEAELLETIDTLTRAIQILSREMAKNPAAFAQMDSKNAVSALKALSVVLDAAAFPGQDQMKLTAFVQSKTEEEGDDAEFGAPAAAAYKTHSGGIVDVLEDLKEKAEEQLSDLRKAEVNSRHNFDMLRQSLEDQIGADTKDMEEEKAGRASAEQAKATAEADLEVTNKDLASSQEQLSTAHSTCGTVAATHATTVKDRSEELRVLAQAKKILTETTDGAASQTYSFLQIRTRSDLAGSEVVEKVKKIAKQQHSTELAQLASRIASVLRFGAAGGDVFGKVKGLIRDMIARLEKEAGAEATEKAYCDEQIAKTEARKSELEDDVSKMTSRIDQASARSAKLTAEVKALEAQLAALAKEQAEMDRIRQESHADYSTAKADLELGLSGVRKAISVLQEYYGASASMLQDDAKLGAFMQQPAAPEAHSSSTGAGQSIIDILQVVESDFAKNLADEESEEDAAQSLYEKTTQENKVTRTTKEQGVKYKTEEARAQDNTVAEYSADRETANTELTAVLDYYSKIRDRCIAKPESYADRAARRAAEIAGLKEALSILENETALLQHKRRSSFLA